LLQHRKWNRSLAPRRLNSITFGGIFFSSSDTRCCLSLLSLGACSPLLPPAASLITWTMPSASGCFKSQLAADADCEMPEDCFHREHKVARKQSTHIVKNSLAIGIVHISSLSFSFSYISTSYVGRRDYNFGRDSQMPEIPDIFTNPRSLPSFPTSLHPMHPSLSRPLISLARSPSFCLLLTMNDCVPITHHWILPFPR
jgi:hypothetical protein